MNTSHTITLFGLMLVLSACQKPMHAIKDSQDQINQVQQVMQKHLDAVSNRDLETLIATLYPDGPMQLILPGQEIIESVAGFIEFHQNWFAQPNWTFETQILNAEVGESMAMVVVQIIYREPERDGQPYFNRMIVSYDLKRIDGNWYVIKDHASSVEKSTDYTAQKN